MTLERNAAFCGRCRKRCRSNAIFCDQCRKWSHSSCEGLTLEYTEFFETSALDYICATCCCASEGRFDYQKSTLRLQCCSQSFEEMKEAAIREKILLRSSGETFLHREGPTDVIHKDEPAACIIETTGMECDGKIPVEVPGDGNCLFHALILAIGGQPMAVMELRVRICVELLLNFAFYDNQHKTNGFNLVSPDFLPAVHACVKDGEDSSVWILQAAASVLKKPIRMYYPAMNGPQDKTLKILNKVIHPRENTNSPGGDEIHIMWSRYQDGTKHAGLWRANHFVPLLESASIDIKGLDEGESLHIVDRPCSIIGDTMTEEGNQWIFRLGLRDPERVRVFLQSLGVWTLDDLEFVTPAEVDNSQLKFVEREKLKRGLRELAKQRGWRTEEDPGPSCSRSSPSNRSIFDQLETLRRGLDLVMKQASKLKMSDADIEKKRRQKTEAQRRWRQKIQNDSSKDEYRAKVRKTERDRKRRERERARQVSSVSDRTTGIPECDQDIASSSLPNISTQEHQQANVSGINVQPEGSSNAVVTARMNNHQQHSDLNVTAQNNDSVHEDVHTEFVQTVMPPNIQHVDGNDLPRISTQVTPLLPFTPLSTQASTVQHAYTYAGPGESSDTSNIRPVVPILPVVRTENSQMQPLIQQTKAGSIVLGASGNSSPAIDILIQDTENVMINQPASHHSSHMDTLKVIAHNGVSSDTSAIHRQGPGVSQQITNVPGTCLQTNRASDEVPHSIVPRACMTDAEPPFLNNQNTHIAGQNLPDRQYSLSPLQTLADVAAARGEPSVKSKSALETNMATPQSLDEFLDNLPPTPAEPSSSSVTQQQQSGQYTQNFVIDPAPSVKPVSQHKLLENNDGSGALVGTPKSDSNRVSGSDQQAQNKLLLDASKSGHLEKVRQLLAAGASVNANDVCCYTALFHASGEGHTDVVRELLEHGADVEQRWRKPLIEAAWRGKLEVVRMLIKKGASVNAEDIEGHTALSLASGEGHTDVVRELLEHGADVEQGEMKLLIEAAWSGKLELVRVLIEKGASVNAKDVFGDTALWRASGEGHTDVIRELLEHGADVEQGKEKLLIEAAWSGKLELVRTLIEKGASVNAEDGWGDTALFCASGEGYTEVVRELLEHGADVEKGQSKPLIQAAGSGKLEVVRMLIEKGADVNGVDADSKTALMSASRQGHTDIVRLLTEKGADVNVLAADGYTALIWASSGGHTDTVRLLLVRGASVNSRDAKGHTALWHVRSEQERTRKRNSTYEEDLRQRLPAAEDLLLEWGATV